MERIQEKATWRVVFKQKALGFLSSGQYFSGISDYNQMDKVTKHVMLNIFLLVGLIIFIPFTIGIALDPSSSSTIVIIDSSFCAFMLLLLVITRTKIPFIVPASLLVSAYTAFVCYMLILHPFGGYGGALWSMILPPLAYYVLGVYGIIPTAIASIAMIYAFDADPIFYEPDYALRCAMIFVFTLAFASLSYKRMQVLTLALVRSRERVNNELLEVQSMKDNLEIGLFYLDTDCKIQPHYSSFLNSVLEQKELAYVDFTSLLVNSLQKKEIELLKDFLDMIRHSNHDSETLRDVNPLQKFTYISESGSKKTLSIMFSKLNRPNHEVEIFGAARDITVETDLEERLAKEELFRQAEMKAMFEVMHVPPQVLNEFLDEVDYEFGRMNEVLKDNSRPKSDVYRELFQGIHALKSNALVIGLDSPAARFHEFEDKLALLIENPTDSYESMLEIVFELERVMDIAENLRVILQKMENFTEANKQLDSSEILQQRIRNTIKKAQANVDKQVNLHITKLDWASLSNDYRRALKEIILQLTRNSMAHGIEVISERRAKKKLDEGRISLQIEKKDDKIYMEFSDDGAGIDFEKVKKQAIEKKLLENAADLENTSKLIKTIFMAGFSTADSLSMQSGRGIGLNLVADRIKEFKGSIKVQSALNRGTKFIIELPL